MITRFLLAACAAGVLIAPAMADAAVVFDSFRVGSHVDVRVNSTGKSDDADHTYFGTGNLKAGVTKTATKTVNKPAHGEADATSSTSVLLTNRRNGTYSFTQAGHVSAIAPADQAEADAEGIISYQFELNTHPYDITLTGSVTGTPYTDGGGQFEVFLFDSSLNQLGYQLIGAGQSFTETLSGLGAGTYVLWTDNLSPNDTLASINCGCGTLPSAGVTGKFSFNIAAAAVPEPGTWAMMMLGLLGTGAVLRRRRERAVALA